MKDIIIEKKVTRSNKKAKRIQTLTDENVDWIHRQKNNGWEPPFSNIERGRFNRIRRLAKKEISDLTLLAESLPENQLKQIFTVKNLKPLIEAILRSERVENEKLVKNRRVWDLAMFLITESENSAWHNIGTAKNQEMLMSERKQFDRIRMIRTLQRFFSLQ